MTTAAKTTAVFPGSFDPPTRGHEDLIARALAIFGRLVVAIGSNSAKTSTFTVAERIELLHTSLGARPGLEIRSFQGLLTDYCRQEQLGPVVRGLRNSGDFDYERTMTHQNRTLAPDLDTVFLMPSLEFTFTSSTLIREIVAGGGDASPWLSDTVLAKLERKLRK